MNHQDDDEDDVLNEIINDIFNGGPNEDESKNNSDNNKVRSYQTDPSLKQSPVKVKRQMKTSGAESTPTPKVPSLAKLLLASLLMDLDESFDNNRHDHQKSASKKEMRTIFPSQRPKIAKKQRQPSLLFSDLEPTSNVELIKRNDREGGNDSPRRDSPPPNLGGALGMLAMMKMLNLIFELNEMLMNEPMARQRSDERDPFMNRSKSEPTWPSPLMKTKNNNKNNFKTLIMFNLNPKKTVRFEDDEWEDMEVNSPEDHGGIHFRLEFVGDSKTNDHTHPPPLDLRKLFEPLFTAPKRKELLKEAEPFVKEHCDRFARQLRQNSCNMAAEIGQIFQQNRQQQQQSNQNFIEQIDRLNREFEENFLNDQFNTNQKSIDAGNQQQQTQQPPNQSEEK